MDKYLKFQVPNQPSHRWSIEKTYVKKTINFRKVPYLDSRPAWCVQKRPEKQNVHGKQEADKETATVGGYGAQLRLTTVDITMENFHKTVFCCGKPHSSIKSTSRVINKVYLIEFTIVRPPFIKSMM